MEDLKILAVDDSPAMRKVIINTLKRAGFTNIVVAENGTQALEKLRTEGADFVLTDWSMPEIDGLSFITELRSDEELKNMPVLLVTTRSLKDDTLEAMKAGVDGYILKPFSPETLAEKINELMAKA